MTAKTAQPSSEKALKLVEKMMTLVNIRGKTFLSRLQVTDDLVKYHRLRASMPAKLWKWTEVASWTWTGDKEHINALEVRTVLTALRWRLERYKRVHFKAATNHAQDLCASACYAFPRGVDLCSHQRKSSGCAKSAPAEEKMGSMPKRHLEAKLKQNALRSVKV